MQDHPPDRVIELKREDHGHRRTEAETTGRGIALSAHFALAFRCLAFLRAFAEALAAFWARARRSSAVIVRSEAFPPFLPNSARYFDIEA